MSKLQRILVGSLTAVMTLTMSFVVAPTFANAAVGDLVKSASSNTVYVVDADGVTIHPFPHANVYESWGYPMDYSTVQVMDLSSYTVGNAVEFRDGSLVRSLTAPDVYYIENLVKKPILSEATFLALGLDWDDITWLTDAFLADYTTGSMISVSGSHVDGQLVKYANNPAIYLLDGGMKRAFHSASAFEANRYDWNDYVVIPDTETYSDGAMIMGYEAALSLPVGIGGTLLPPSGSGLTVSLDSSTPAGATIVSDSTGSQGAQVLAPFVSVRFTAAADGAVKVKTLRFKRTGISADSDIQATYLYEGMNRLEVGGSLSGGYVTFNNPNGLFEVPAGQSKVVTLRGDLATNLGGGKTIAFQLESASDVTTNGASVSGSFPSMGNTMTTAATSDLGYALIAGSYTTPSSDNTSINPEADTQVWSFTLQANDQDLEVRKLVLTKVGSVQKDDIQNFRLLVGGSQYATASGMNDDFEVVFDLSGNPLQIAKGQTKTITVRADIVNGSSRDFKFTFQQQDDLMIWDRGYNVYVPAATSIANYGSWTVVQPSGDYQVASGAVSITKATNSPSGDVALDATNVKVASYEVKATGEDVKISSLKVAANTSGTGLDNGKLFLDGVQVGSTSDIGEWQTSTTTYTFGSSFIAKAGETHVLDVYSDVKQAAGTSFSAGNTILLYIGIGSSNAQGQSSLSAISVPAAGGEVAGNTLTVQSSSLSISENVSYGDQTVTAGSKNVKIGSFTLVAGATEGVNVDGITCTLDSSEDDRVENLKLMSGTTQLGSTKVTPSTSNLFSVNMSLTPGQSKLVDVYADMRSGATGTVDCAMTSTGVGSVTSSSVSASSVVIQTMTIGTGSLTASLDPASPASDIILGGSTGVTMAKYKFTATTDSFTVNKMTFITGSSTADNVSAVYLEYPKADGSTGTALGYLNSNATVTFNNLGFFIDRDSTAVMTLKVDLASIGFNGTNADSGDAPGFDFDVSDTFEAVAGSGSSDTDADSTAPVNISSDVAGNDMVLRKTRPTITLETLPTTNLAANGTYAVSKFTVTADAKGPVSVYKVGWDVATNGITYTTAVLYDSNNTALTASSTATSSSYIRIEFNNSSTEQMVVGAGASKTYSLKVAIAGVGAAGDSFASNLASPYTTTTTGDAYTVSASENALVWSDNASSTQSNTYYNWANAQYVKTLPSDTQSLYFPN